MPSFDDRSEFPPSRRGRPARAPRSRRDGSAQDWRHPDPGERYSQDYEEFANPRSQDSDAEEWQHSPAAQDSFASFERLQRRETFEDDRDWDRAGSGWNDQAGSDDPFNWDAPEPPEEPGWRDDTFGRGSYMEDGFERDSFTANGGWDEEDAGDFAPTRLSDPEPQGQRMRDDSLFRRIDGSVQDPDLAALTGRADADPFAAESGADPSALGDRFFSSMAEADGRDPHAPTNVFPLDPQRARYPEPDDPYAWDEGYDAPDAHRDDPAAAYAAAPDHYDDYRLDDDLHPDDDLDADFLDDEPETIEAPVPEPRSRRKLMVAGVLVAAVATGGGAAFVYKSYQDGSLANLEAPTLLADSGPVKGEPSDPGGKEFPDGNKQIYDRLSGEPAKPVAEQTATDSDASASIPGIVTTGAEAPADTLDERIAQALRRSGSPSGQTDAASADPDSPRTVRTLTIRPDGSVAPAAAPEPPKPDEAQTVTTAGIIATSGPETDTAESTKPASEPEDKTDTAAASAPRPERAAPRPKETRVASAEPASTASTQPQTASANPYFVQLAARRDQTSALAAFADLQQKYPSILNGLAPTIKKADLGDKGVWYRLWVGPMNTRGNAEDVCGKLKGAGLGGCFVRTE
jgi:cell division protein FtsN